MGRVLVIFALLAAGLCGGAIGQGQDSEPGQAAAESARALRERWETLDDEQRASLRERFERLKAMSPEERERALTLARRMHAESEETLRSLRPRDREAINALEPKERERVLRGLAADRARIMAARVRAHMTAEERAALKSADASERSRIIGGVRTRVLGELPSRARRLGEELGLSGTELERFSSSDPKECRAGMIAVARRRANKFVKTKGLPESVTQEEWERISALPDRDFARTIQRIRAQHPEFAVPSKRFDRHQRRRDDFARQMVTLGTPTPRDRARAPGAQDRWLQRGAVLRQRQRIEDAMSRKLQLSVDTMAQVRLLDDDAFVGLHRHLVRQLDGNADPGRSLERWLEKGPRNAGDRPGEAGGRGRSSRGRWPKGRESGGRQDSKRED